jgi:hypothetical protein
MWPRARASATPCNTHVSHSHFQPCNRTIEPLTRLTTLANSLRPVDVNRPNSPGWRAMGRCSCPVSPCQPRPQQTAASTVRLSNSFVSARQNSRGHHCANRPRYNHVQQVSKNRCSVQHSACRHLAASSERWRQAVQQLVMRHSLRLHADSMQSECSPSVLFANSELFKLHVAWRAERV